MEGQEGALSLLKARTHKKTPQTNVCHIFWVHCWWNIRVPKQTLQCMNAANHHSLISSKWMEYCEIKREMRRKRHIAGSNALVKPRKIITSQPRVSSSSRSQVESWVEFSRKIDEFDLTWKTTFDFVEFVEMHYQRTSGWKFQRLSSFSKGRENVLTLLLS